MNMSSSKWLIHIHKYCILNNYTHACIIMYSGPYHTQFFLVTIQNEQMQENGDDCGIFVCKVVRKFLNNNIFQTF